MAEPLSPACQKALDGWKSGKYSFANTANRWQMNGCPGPFPPPEFLSAPPDPNTRTVTATATATTSKQPDLEFAARYYYYLQSSSGLELTVLRAETPPQLTGGRGGWQVIDRRRRKGLTSWTGRDPLSMDLPILFNGWFDPPYSVDQDISVMQQMALGDNFVIPPTVTVEGILPATGVKWVIQDVKWGTDAIWIQGDDGFDIRVRQDAVVSLLEYVQEDVVSVINVAQGEQGTTYVTKKGDTLKSIAKTKYKNAQQWRWIAANNPGVRDPNNVAEGTSIWLPPLPK